ncbi:hypothetical protein LZ683_11000 [Comamonas testosteroni]|uniref:hypothetical protein n=1 Tax=Comamonas testosteroni TaxID=285 RepID=UPI0023AA2561|nr:hypothetical protein [Comamonas testosteroni]WEE79834.1 hypothetical protein LZ683_11000 [Comamonas testosteroni]
MNDKKVPKNIFSIILTTHLLVFLLLIRSVFIGIYGDGEKKEYFLDPISIGLAIMIFLMIFARWFILGRNLMAIDSKSSRQIYLASTEISDQMHHGLWYFIKMIPNSNLLEKSSEIAVVKNIVILDNFDIYRVFFLTKNFLFAIFVALFTLLGGLYLGVDILPEGYSQVFMPVIPVVMTYFWAAVAYLTAWIALYSSINIFRRK